MERELEKSNFILRDCIGDLIGWEDEVLGTGCMGTGDWGLGEILTNDS